MFMGKFAVRSKALFGLTAIFAVAAMLQAASAFAGDTVYYYYTDSLHSAVAVTDAQGNVIERTYYAPYGQVLNRDLRDGPGYTGHEEDPETNLVYMQQRYYCPECGRFLSTDPVGVDPTSGGNFNRYEYANDNPYRYTDPDGRESGAGYATGEYTLALPPSSPEARDVALTMVGLVPVVGDVQNVVDAYNNPSVATIAIAAVGLVPEAGAAIADAAKIAKVAAKGAADGERAGKVFTRAGKAEIKESNAATHGGQTTCSNCGRSTTPAQQSRAGVTPPGNETHVDHIIPKSKGGNGSPDNGQVLCRDCNLKKSDHDH